MYKLVDLLITFVGCLMIFCYIYLYRYIKYVVRMLNFVKENVNYLLQMHINSQFYLNIYM